MKPDLRECEYADVGLKLDHDVNVAVRPILAAGRRAENGCVNDSASPQILGVRVQGGKYGIDSHHVQSCPVPTPNTSPADRARLRIAGGRGSVRIDELLDLGVVDVGGVHHREAGADVDGTDCPVTAA